MGKRRAVAEGIKKFASQMDTLSKGFGKFTDEEAKLMNEVKEGLGKGSKEYQQFVDQMSSARKQNSLNAYSNADKPTFAERKAARTQQNQQRSQEKMQAQYDKYSSGAYDTVTSPQAPQPEPKGPDYSSAKGRKDTVKDFQADPKNLPATPEQLQQQNQGFNDMMSGAAHDATGPRTVESNRPPSGKGQKDYTETWESSKKKSWEQAANTTEVRDGSGELAEYKSPAQQREEWVERGAKHALKQRTLENANKTGWERVKDVAADIWAGSELNKGTTANRRAYNERLHAQGSNEYVKSNRQFQQMQQNMGIHGTYTGAAEGFEAMHKVQSQADAAAKAAADAEAAAKAEEFSQWWAGKADGLANFAKENPMITAAGIAGTAVIGASLLDND